MRRLKFNKKAVQRCSIYLSVLLCQLLIVGNINAQTHISGTVRDAKTNELMTGTSVVVKEIYQGTITDGNGKYEITVPNGKYTLVFSFLGYQDIEKKIDCNKEKITVEVSLQPSVMAMDEVVVTAKSKARRIREKAMPISVITMKQLQGTVSNVSDVLSKTSGVKIRASGGVGSASRISVRGLEGKRVGFFINGTPLSDNSDFVDINDIPVDMIERIEIYKGIVPANLGGSAIGGAVNIVTKEYPPGYIDASYTIQSFNTHKASAIFKRNRNGLEFGIGGFYTYSDNNYKMVLPKEYGGDTVTRDHDNFQKIVIATGLTSRKWWFDEMIIEPAIIYSEKEIQGIKSNIQEAKSFSNAYILTNNNNKKNFLIEGLDLDFDNTYGYTIYKFQDKSMYLFNWDGTHKDTVFNKTIGIGEGEIGKQPNDALIKKHSFHQKINLNYVINARNSINLNSQYRYVRGIPEDPLKDKVIGYKTNFNSNMNSWTLGLAYEYNSANKKFTNVINGKYYYYRMQTKLVKGLDLDFDSTPENIDNRKSDFGISNALRYRITPSFLIKTSLAYDVRLPVEEELLGDGFMIAASENLVPERNTSFNLGFMFDKSNAKHNRLQVEVNGFYMYLTDMIRFTGGRLQSIYKNFGEMRTLGVEIEIKADVTNWLYLWGNATYQDLRDVRKYEAGSEVPNPTKDYRIPNIPYLFANGGIELHKANLFGIKGQNTRLYTDCSFVEEYFYDFEMSKKQQRRIPRTITFNAGLEHSLHNQTIFISIQANNITDKRVMSEFNRPLPGRNFGLKLRYVWK